MNKNGVIMPKATALWLKENTSLTLQQISDFCEIDLLTIDSLKIENMQPLNPINSGQLTEIEILKAQDNPKYKLSSSFNFKSVLPPKSSKKYIPLAYKLKKPGMIAWFLNQTPEFLYNDELYLRKIAKALSSNLKFVQKTVASLLENNGDRDESIVNPIDIGVCSQGEVSLILNYKK